MRKKRIYNGNKGINLAALVVFLLCLGLYWLHFSAYYKNGGRVYTAEEVADRALKACGMPA